MAEESLSPKQQEAKITAKIKNQNLSALLPSQSELMSSVSQEDSPPETDESKSHTLSLNKPEEKVVPIPVEKDFKNSKYSEAEQQAVDKGWQPKDSYKGSPDKWVSADEYLVRSKMIGQIDVYRKDLSDLKKSNKMLLDLIRKQTRDTTEEKAEKLLKLKRDAIVEGDIEAAEAYEKKYYVERQEIDSIKALELKQQAQSTIDPETQEFVDRNNGWFNRNTPQNSAMYEYAVQQENELIKRYPHWSTIKRLEEVEKMVKLFFSDKFENPAREKASLVESVHRKPPADPTKITFDDLPPEVQAIAKRFKKIERPTKNGRKMSNDEYAQQLLRIGAIKYD